MAPSFDLLSKLDDPSSTVRARMALRLGWMRYPQAAEAILARLPDAVDELCSYVDALGFLGDPMAIPAVREIASRKLLSRRRSGVEALYNLADAEGLKTVHKRAISELPNNVQAAVEETDSAEAIVKSLKTITDPKRLGLYLDTLYELADPVANEAIKLLLDTQKFDQPFIWRYVKSLLKRATLRGDYAMFGWLAHRIERQAKKSKGRTANVKSGYDGADRNTPIFRSKTQKFVRRSNWRHLRKMAHYQPELYPLVAAEALIPYTEQDTQVPVSRMGRFADCYLLHRILFGESARFELDDRRLRFLFLTANDTQPPAGVREESYPELWDEYPNAYLRLLSAANLIEVHKWAIEAIERSHPELLQEATPEELLGMLAAPYQETVKVGLEELHRRFHPEAPDWELLDQLLKDNRPFVLEIARKWIEQTVSLWITDIPRCLAWLQTEDPETRELVVNLVTAHLVYPKDKQHWAEEILKLLDGPITEQLEGPLRIARWVLLDELAARLSVEHCLHLITSDFPAVQGLGAAVLGRHPGIYSRLTEEQILWLAEHETAAVRRAAQSLIVSAEIETTTNPAILFALVESEWEDNRALAARLLAERIDWTTAGIEPLMALLDSNRPDVQKLGQDLVEKHLASTDPGLLTNRLTEHSHPKVRRFAMRMVEEYLPNSAIALEAIAEFFRKGLLDTWPDRKTKTRMLNFLAERGEGDRGQAVVAMKILHHVLRSQTLTDFELALAAAARLKLAHPDLPSDVSVMLEGVP